MLDVTSLYFDFFFRYLHEPYYLKYSPIPPSFGCIIFRTDNVKFFCITVLLLFSPFLRQNKRDGPHANLIKERTPSLWKIIRSEEHTSELQSRYDHVCRMMHEKKKNIINNIKAIILIV